MSDAGGAMNSDRYRTCALLAALFSFEGRQTLHVGSGRDYLSIHRAATLWLAGAATIFGIVLYPLVGGWAGLAVMVPAACCVWVNLALVARRSHDVGWSAKWPLVLLSIASGLLLVAAALAFDGVIILSILAALIAVGIIIPLAAVVLLHPGTAGPNRFGPDPRETK